jgi:hypothetical protein
VSHRRAGFFYPDLLVRRAPILGEPLGKREVVAMVVAV